MAQTDAFKAFGEAHAAMLAAYREGRFAEANGAIEELRKRAPDGFAKLYDLYVERCRGAVGDAVERHAAGAAMTAGDATPFARQAVISSSV